MAKARASGNTRTMDFAHSIELVSKLFEAAGAAAMVVGILVATWLTARRMHAGQPSIEAYRHYRHGIGRAILLGLEFLVAADILRTVTLDLTLTSVAALGGIVLVRTFLSMSLEVELEGEFPWRRHARRKGTESMS